MKKATIIYWSGTGNTELMPTTIAEGMIDNNVITTVSSVESATKEMVSG